MARVSQGDTFEWFDGDEMEIEYVADDGRVFYRDSEGLHKTQMSTLKTVFDNDTERYPLLTEGQQKPRFVGRLCRV